MPAEADSTPKSLSELRCHLANRPLHIAGSKYYFTSVGALGVSEATLPFYMERLAPLYNITLKESGSQLQLWCGWLGGTYHMAHAWTMGSEMTVTAAGLVPAEADFTGLGRIHQRSSITDIHGEIMWVLDQLCDKLTQWIQKARYRLSWAEAAATMLHLIPQGENRPADTWGLGHTLYPTLGTGWCIKLTKIVRGGVIEATVSHGQSAISGLTVRMSRSQGGWRADFFSPGASGPDACRWLGATGFHCDYTDLPLLKICPNEHGHSVMANSSTPFGLLRDVQRRYSRWIRQWDAINDPQDTL